MPNFKKLSTNKKLFIWLILLPFCYESYLQTNNELTLSEQFWTKNPKAENNSSTHLAAGFAG